MLFPILLILLPFLQHASSQAVDANGITLYEKLEVMERLLLEFQGLETSVNPCKFFQTGNPASGQQTAAEWVRIVFHDAITADIAAGTGGLDASIGFESDRAENTGLHFVNDTISIFSNFFSAYTSMADIIGLGLADSLISCDPTPRLIKLRVGRKDALGPGPTGVPKPEDDLPSTLATFAKAGFNQSEAIASVACGHSLGAVHHVNFPEIVDPSVINENNLDGGDTFDSTTDVFDNTNVLEYLNGTGKRGGPLVVGHNETTRSDLRLFKSDNNATIKTMTSAQAFQDKCYTLFEKMLNTVPSDVVLSNVIIPRTWTMKESHLELSSTGVVSFLGEITSNFKSDTPPATASFQYTTVGGGNTGPQTSQAGVSYTKRGYGTVTNYAFNNILNSPSITGISVMNGAYTAPVNPNLFVIPSQSFRKSGSSPTGGPQFIIRVAVLSTLAPIGTALTTKLYHPTPQALTLAPKVATASATMALKTTIGSYSIFQAVINPGAIGNGRSIVDVKLGSTQSTKVSTLLFGTCTNDVITNC